MTRSRWWCVLACGALGACASEDPVEPGAATARDRLADGEAFFVDPDASRVTMHLTIGEGDKARVYAIDAPVGGGMAVGMIDDAGDLWVDELTVSHEAFTLPLAMDYRGTGMGMTSLVIRSDGAFRFPDTAWSDDEAVALTPDAAGLVTVSWDVIAGGIPVVEVERETMIHTSAMVLSGDGRFDLLVMGETHPVTWQWGELTLRTTLEVSIDTYAVE